MYDFEYRTPRFPADFPVDLVVGENTLRGRCSNIGSSGIRAEFDAVAAVGSVGLLSMTDCREQFRLYARITYFASLQSGLAFLFRSEEERARLLRFIESLSRRFMGGSV